MLVKKFNPNLKLKDYLVEGEYRRTQIRFITEELDVVAEKIALGWSFFINPKGFLLIAPEKWIVDLAEPFKVSFYTNNPNINLAYYNFIKNQIKESSLKEKIHSILQDQSTQFFLSKGPALQTEVRIILENKRIGDIIANLLFIKFFEDNNYKDYIDKANAFLGKTREIKIQRYRKINDYPKKIKNLFLQIKDYYSLINISNRDLFSYDYVFGVAEQFSKEFQDADVFIFIPWGCFKYLANFITEEMVDKIMFWEMHFGKYNEHSHKLKKKKLKGKKVIIIDKGYTGSTINKLAGLVKRQGGFPVRVTLFPKSDLAIRNSDYTVFLDKLIKSSEVKLSDPNWFVNLYKNVLKE
ncbi:MAG: hypothetical protein PHN37_02115 [Candidatus Pacebacteria bacterium]|nr:hypothetical protein [Candidatus Paceibacterota bacterium]